MKETLVPTIGYYCAEKDCPKDTLKEMFANTPKHIVAMPYPGVAIGVVVLHGESEWLLLGKRKGELGTGQYSLPGGKVDFGETPLQAAVREVKEETNLDLDMEKVCFTTLVTNDYFPEEGKQFLCMYYIAVCKNPTELKVMEPDKVESWDWHNPETLPEPMWSHTGRLIASLFSGEKFDNPDIGEIPQSW